MSFLLDIDAAAGDLGGKARSLALLAAQSCATPPGFVVADTVFRALLGAAEIPTRLDQGALVSLDELRVRILRAQWPAGFRDALRARLQGIAARSYAVRSSFAGEDAPSALAAGVFESRVDVAPDAVETAIRQVLCSALGPGAVAYALARGQAPAASPVAVLVHAYVAGDAEGSAAFARGRMAAPLIELRRGALAPEAAAALAARLAELEASRGPTEIEWVAVDRRLVYLQARPFSPPAPVAEWSGFQDLDDREAWRWDMAHNPLPLSPAQAGLVELVDARAVVGIRQRVLGGYLFYRRDVRPLPPGIACEAAAAYFASLRARVQARLAGLGPRPALEDALALFVSAYEPIFGVLQPALREAQRRLRAFLEAHAKAGIGLLPALRASVPSVASERLLRMAAIRAAATDAERERACSAYLLRFGDEAAMWDVCAKTFAEDPSALAAGGRGGATAGPAALSWQQASAEVEAMLAADLRPEWRKVLEVAREACALGEADDWLYARTQAAVRRALLGVGERLCACGGLACVDDIFFLPLAPVREIASGHAAPPDLRGRADQGRRAWEKARADPPPLPEAGDGRAVRGAGTGGRAIGRVVHHRPGEASPPDAVLVAPSLLPTELPLVEAAAIVSETGGPLDHVAAQARERGLACVVGAAGASAIFAEGELVLVDADRGLVVALT